MKTTKDIDGWFNHHAAYDYLLANMPSDGTFVELGAWLGKSSSYLCDKATGQNIVIVDDFKGTAEYLDTFYRLVKSQDVYKLFLENMGTRNFRCIKTKSKTAVKKFADESLDVVFIDLDHSYKAVKEDIRLWLPKVKKGGYIAGDDYHENWRGVIRAVDELLPRATFIDDCWIYQR